MADGGTPRILFVVSEDWYFLSHRLPMARAAKAAGFTVDVACQVSEGATAITAEGFTLHPIHFKRGALSPFSALRTIAELRNLYARIRPAIVHHVSIQPAVLGSIATIGLSAACVNALTGFGYVFTSRTLKAQLMRPLFSLLMRALLGRRHTIALVQNPDDQVALEAIGIPARKIVVIPGSGVDTEKYRPTPELPGPVTVLFVGRLLDDKGIRNLVRAKKILNKRSVNFRLMIAGAPDEANPTSVRIEEAQQWNEIPGTAWLGHKTDMVGLWTQSHIGILPSRREGLPLSLLEAAACGRPLIATNVPGCREIAVDGVTGLLVPVDDSEALADAITKLVQSSEMRKKLGGAARRRVEERFSTTVVAQQIVKVYRSLLIAE